ncbi:MAG: hypothetical protein ACTSYR_02485 [Candidatus Odinarchaeia archaeon]
MSLKPLIIDSNFFIIGFKDNPQDIYRFKQICEEHGYTIYTSFKVFQELDWRIKRELKYRINVLDINKADVEEFIKKYRNKFDYLPQKPDLSLILLAEKLKDPILVSSDFKLIETANSVLDSNSLAVMSSAFLLKMIGEEANNEYKQLLISIREKIYSEELRYSIQRQNFYDPIKRIKLIENQSLEMIKNIRIPTSLENYEWSSPNVTPLLFLIKELKQNYKKYLREIKVEKHHLLINEFNNIRREIYNTLLLLIWQLDKEEREKLIKLVNPDLVILNYLTAICYLYEGTKDSIYKAYKRLESASGILLIGLIPEDLYRILMISLHQLRIVVLILLKKYQDASFYFSLYERKCEEWGYEKQFEYSRGIYYALINLQGNQIIEEISHSISNEPALRFLIDLANQFFRLKEFEESRRILNQAFILNLEIGKYNYFKEILNLGLLLFYAYDNSRVVLDLARFIEEIKKRGFSNLKLIDFVDSIWDEIRNKKIPLLPEVTSKKISYNSLPQLYLDWMTVFKIIINSKKDDKIKVICRNWKIQTNVTVILYRKILRKPIIPGDQIKIGGGYFNIVKNEKELYKKYNSPVKIIPDKKDYKIFIRGITGYNALEHSSESLIDLTEEEKKVNLKSKIRQKLGL